MDSLDSESKELRACFICGGEVVPATTAIDYEGGPVSVRVEGVPALQCLDCGETYVHGPVGVRLGAEVRRVLAELPAIGGDSGALAPRSIVLIATRELTGAA